MIQTPILIAAELSSKGEKFSFRPISLFLDQTEALRVEKNFFGEPPPTLPQGLDDRLPANLKVWIPNCKMSSNNLCIRFGTWKIRRLNQSRFKVAPKAKFIPLSRSKSKHAFLIDSDAVLFMYLTDLILCSRFGSWKVRPLNRALISQALLGWTKAICFLFSLSCKNSWYKTKIAQIDEFSYGDCSGNLLTSPFLFQKMSLSNPHFVA